MFQNVLPAILNAESKLRGGQWEPMRLPAVWFPGACSSRSGQLEAKRPSQTMQAHSTLCWDGAEVMSTHIPPPKTNLMAKPWDRAGLYTDLLLGTERISICWKTVQVITRGHSEVNPWWIKIIRKWIITYWVPPVSQTLYTLFLIFTTNL